MIYRRIATLLALAGLAGSVLAVDGRNAGSLLLFPEFDNSMGCVTVVTVTNTDAAGGDVDVEFAAPIPATTTSTAKSSTVPRPSRPTIR